LNIKWLCKKKGISRKELAEVLGLSLNTLSNYENNYTMPNKKVLNQLLNVFECSHSELLDDNYFLKEFKNNPQ
jgi:transcriptional regulator with XRE-family HTH domain